MGRTVLERPDWTRVFPLAVFAKRTASKKGEGGEIGEYVAMLQSAIDSASTVERLASAVLGAIGVGAVVLGAIAPV